MRPVLTAAEASRLDAASSVPGGGPLGAGRTGGFVGGGGNGSGLRNPRRGAGRSRQQRRGRLRCCSVSAPAGGGRKGAGPGQAQNRRCPPGRTSRSVGRRRGRGVGGPPTRPAG